jgi:hypothetical protein
VGDESGKRRRIAAVGAMARFGELQGISTKVLTHQGGVARGAPVARVAPSRDDRHGHVLPRERTAKGFENLSTTALPGDLEPVTIE